jgi:hypothetical protein
LQATCTAPSADCQQKVVWRRLKKRLRKQKLLLRLTLNLLPTRDALINPRFGSATMQLLLECGATAIAGGTRECEGCAQRWAMDRPVVGIGIFEFLSVEAAFLVGLCPTCWNRPDRLQTVVAGLKRDFNLPEIETTILPAGGRA